MEMMNANPKNEVVILIVVVWKRNYHFVPKVSSSQQSINKIYKI